jgi:uncharacterized membrane protein YgcG
MISFKSIIDFFRNEPDPSSEARIFHASKTEPHFKHADSVEFGARRPFARTVTKEQEVKPAPPRAPTAFKAEKIPEPEKPATRQPAAFSPTKLQDDMAANPALNIAFLAAIDSTVRSDEKTSPMHDVEPSPTSNDNASPTSTSSTVLSDSSTSSSNTTSDYSSSSSSPGFDSGGFSSGGFDGGGAAFAPQWR